MNSNGRRITGTTDIWAVLNHWAILIAFAIGFIAGSIATAHADVLCRPKNGTVVRVRTACKAQEVQLDPIALGLQGPAGPTGPQGVQGEMGPQGIAGAELHLFDANGQDLGIFVGLFDGLLTTYAPALQGFLKFGNNDLSHTAGVYSSGVHFYSLTTNCQGAPISTAVAPQGVYIKYSNDGTYWMVDQVLPQGSTTTFSRLDADGCKNLTTIISSPMTFREIQLPFSLPLAWPLTVGLAP